MKAVFILSMRIKRGSPHIWVESIATRRAGFEPGVRFSVEMHGSGVLLRVADDGEPLPLVAFEAPCLMRNAATAALDRAGIAWRLAFSSASLNGIWAAVAAGLGITIRTSAGLPAQLQVLTGMPELPSIGLLLHRAEAEPNAVIKQLETIILEKLGQLLPVR